MMRRIGELGDTHMGRVVTIRGLTGVLVGLMPVRRQVSAVLSINGTRAWTDAYDVSEMVEIHPPSRVDNPKPVR